METLALGVIAAVVLVGFCVVLRLNGMPTDDLADPGRNPWTDLHDVFEED